MPHDGHDHSDNRFSETELRVKALQTLLIDKGLVERDALDALIDTYETQIGPRNGAAVIARAWLDPEFMVAARCHRGDPFTRLCGRQGEHMAVVENTPQVHNMVVCTLCSCYPWPVLGLPPTWYKSAPYRARAVRDPRGVLREFGTELSTDVEIKVWIPLRDAPLVLPMRPAGSDGMDEAALADLVSRNSMIGVELARTPGVECGMNGGHDLGAWTVSDDPGRSGDGRTCLSL